MGTLVYIRSIPRESVSKISEFRNDTSGKKLNKTKFNDRCKDGIQALYSPRVGGLKTGLYKPSPVEGKTLQQWAEENWGLERGYLNNMPATGRSYQVTANKEITYFQRKRWKFNDGTTILDLSNLDDFCFYHVCLESKLVANSEKEWKEHKWPKALYYISHQNESEEIKYTKAKKRAQAISILTNQDVSEELLHKMAVLMGIFSARIKVTKEQVFNGLMQFIEDDKMTVTGKGGVDNFIAMYNKTTTIDGRSYFEGEFFLKELVDWNIVVDKADTYTWVGKGMDLGFSKEEAVKTILHPKKQAIKEDLEKELKLKKGMF